jgi:glyoxylase-like metal-dependent hydrolase (beta-lactamase superfamily II)
MLKIHTLTLGLYQTNTYLIHDEKSTACCVIDPGYEPETILNKVRLLGLNVEAILLTHGHFDHVGAVRDLAAETGCRVYLCGDDLSMPHMMTAGQLYYTHTYGEGSQLQLAGLSIGVLHTPGHTPGSVCLVCENALFSGDTLFSGSCGRTDLPGGDWATILRSLRRLAAIKDDLQVFPGHGESTTLAREKQYNPYMR